MDQYKAKFIWTNGDMPRNWWDYENLYIKIHNVFARESEEHYHKWNAEYDDDGVWDDEGYMRFICEKLAEWCEFRINQKRHWKGWFKRLGVKRACVGNEANLVLELENGAKLDMVLVPV